MFARVETQRPMVGERWPLIESFMSDPATWLPEPAQPCPPSSWRISVKAGPAARVVIAEVGEPWTLPEAFVRPVKWRPVAGHGGEQHASRLVPGFDGRLTLELHDDAPSTLELAGHYEPPGGKVGAAADSVVLHRVAHGTIEALLDHIAQRISQVAGAMT